MMTNIMIAGSILNFLSSIGTDPTIQTEVDESNTFEALIKKSMQNSLKKDLSGNDAQITIFNQKENGSSVYLETLRKGLLAKGKSLDKIYLKDSDINTLTDFLNQCGYNKTDVKKCIEKLLQNHSDGMIRLSDFFSEIEKHPLSSSSASSGKKSYNPICMEPSVIPRIESALKDLGLSLKDADNTLNSARSTSGGLDLNKLIAQLKTLGNRTNKESGKTEDKVSAIKFLEKHQKLGLQITPDNESGNISIERFIAALEQFRDGVSGNSYGTDVNTTENGNNSRVKANIAKVENSADKLPMDIKASMDRIIEKAVSTDEKFELKLTGPSLSRLKSESLKSKEKINDTGDIFQVDRPAESVKKVGNRTIDHGNSGVRSTDATRQESLGRISDLNEVSAYMKDANSEKNMKDLVSKSADILQEGNLSVKFETLSSALRSRSNSSFLPESTIEQLGKQISRSVARGDRIIKLQLTPPELGTVKLSMEIKDGALRLEMIAESAAAREILLTNSHDLKNLLADQGIKLERLDIQVEPNLGRALTDLNEGFGQEHKRYQKTGGGLFSDGDIKEDISSDVLKKAAKDYLLDLTA